MTATNVDAIIDQKLDAILKRLDSIEAQLAKIPGSTTYTQAYMIEAKRLIDEDVAKQIRGPSVADIAKQDRTRGRML